jgi:hypothetical protein
MCYRPQIIRIFLMLKKNSDLVSIVREEKETHAID